MRARARAHTHTHAHRHTHTHTHHTQTHTHTHTHRPQGKAAARKALRDKLGLSHIEVPIVSCVTRLVAQKVCVCV